MDGPGDYSFGSQPLSFGTQAEAELDHTDYELLKFALQNEKASPELLPYEVELVQRVYLQLEHQEQAIQDAEAIVEEELLRTIFTVEVTRVKYMLRSYLRTRLFKVEKFVMHCLDDPDVRQRLSPLEDKYAGQYLRLVVGHLASTVTSKLPEAFSSVFKQASAHPANDMIPVPDLGGHVFARVLRDLGQVQVYEDGGMCELNNRDLYIIRYAMVRPLLASGAVQLI